MDYPTPDQIKTARHQAGLTQTQFGAMVGASHKAVQAWEAGTRNMPPAKWELFNLKIKLIEETKMFVLNVRGNDDRISEQENQEIDTILERLDISFEDLQDTTKVTGWESYSGIINAQQAAHFDRDFKGYGIATVLDPSSDDDGKAIADHLISMGYGKAVPARPR